MGMGPDEDEKNKCKEFGNCGGNSGGAGDLGIYTLSEQSVDRLRKEADKKSSTSSLGNNSAETCPTCPSSKEFDDYRNSKDYFDYEPSEGKAKYASVGAEVTDKRVNQGGKANAFGIGLALGGGYQFEIGKVSDSEGNSEWFISHGPVVGFTASIGFSQKAIRPLGDKSFKVGDYEGFGSGYSVGFLVIGAEFSGNRRNNSYKKTDWNLEGDDYNQLGFGVFTGLDFGLSWSRTKTTFIGKK
jgi:hypothetical protein